MKIQIECDFFMVIFYISPILLGYYDRIKCSPVVHYVFDIGQ